jgi:hypothetical protein
MARKIEWVDIGPIPPNFDGEVFAEANNLKPTDFEVHGGILRAPEGSALVVSRPAMEAVDAGKQAKRSRKKIVDNIDRAVLKLLREMHKRLAVVERSQQTFAEWRDDVLSKFVNDGD